MKDKNIRRRTGCEWDKNPIKFPRESGISFFLKKKSLKQNAKKYNDWVHVEHKMAKEMRIKICQEEELELC